MAWRDQLRPASFRGVPFETTDLGGSFGRDGVEQEPLGDDGAYWDDLGRKARRFTIAAFVIATGDASDYSQRRDALIAAAEQEGNGQLVHPTFGTMQVQCTGCELSETVDEGRSANFSLTFFEVGDGRAFPKATVDKPGVVKVRAATLKEQIDAFFDEVYEVTDQLDYVVSSASDELTDRVDAISDVVGKFTGIIEDVPDVQKRLASLSATATSLVGDVQDLCDAIAERDPLMQIASTITPVTVTATHPSDLQAETNARAVALLVRISAIASAAVAAAEEDFSAYDDALAARDDLVDVMVVDEERDDIQGDLYDALAALRVSVWEDLTDRALQLPRVVTYTPAAITSALELAQLLYRDGSRADEIVARNRLAHPGFIPPEPLKVLAS